MKEETLKGWAKFNKNLSDRLCKFCRSKQTQFLAVWGADFNETWKHFRQKLNVSENQELVSSQFVMYIFEKYEKKIWPLEPKHYIGSRTLQVKI